MRVAEQAFAVSGAGQALPFSALPADAAASAPVVAGLGSAEAPWLVRYRRMGVGDPAFCLYAADMLGSVLIAAVAVPAIGRGGNLPAPVAVGFGLFMLVWTVGAQATGLYGREAMFGSLRALLPRALTVLALSCAAVLVAGFAAGDLATAPRWALLVAAAGTAGWITVARFAWRQFWHHMVAAGYRVDRALVLAETPAAARRLAIRLEKESGRALGVAACAALPGGAEAPTLDWVEATARSGAIDRIVLGSGTPWMPRVNAVLGRLARLAIDVSVLPDMDGLAAPVLEVRRVGMLPAIELDFRPLSPWQARLKRAEDVLLAGAIALFITPVLALIALAIALDSPGPVLFRQKRAGFNDRVFEVWKFRTMHEHARDDLAARQTTRGDARVTRVGRLLRRTSLDELPQLFNVLAGSMSIVGPRPHALGMTSNGAALHDVIEDYSARHRLKPGITGWAQVNGSRGEVTTHEQLRRRVALDCYYIDHWSLRLDLWIIARTAAKLLADADAY